MGQPTSIRSSIMDPLLNFKFIVSWGPSPESGGGNLTVVAGVSKVGPLARTTEVAEYREGAAPTHTRRIIGQTKYDTFSIERGIILDIAFEQWANKVWYYENSGALGQNVSLKDFRKTIKIDHCNQAGQIMNSYYIFNCWPSKYQSLPDMDASAGNTVALETMELQHEGWARDDSYSAPAYPSFDLPASPVIAGVEPPK